MLNRREFLATGSGLVAAPALTGQALVPSGGTPSKSSTTTLLFWDDYYLNRRENISRHLGRPELVPEATFEEPNFWVSSGYPTVFRHRSGIWRMLYDGGSVVPEEQSHRWPLVAESDDGMHWKTPDLTRRVPLPGRRYPHQVMPVYDEFGKPEFGQMGCYYDGRAEDPDERLKMLIVHDDLEKTLLWTSPDGLRWKKLDGVQWRPGRPDPPYTAFWNEARQSYVIGARITVPTGRPELFIELDHPRRVAFSETKDWRHFSKQELALQADALDTPLAELYGCLVFPYEGKFIGLAWLFHTEPKSLDKGWEGTTDCQLVYSYNGWYMQRSIRDPFIPNTAPGQLGGGLIRPHCLLVDDDDRIRIYSSSSRVEHGYHISDYIGRKSIEGPGTGKDKGAILMHRLRLDGFFYLQSNAGPGVLGTRPLLWQGGEARLNVQSGNEVRVQVTGVGRDFGGEDGQVTERDGVSSSQPALEGYSFADCEPFKGDALYWTPRWKNGRGLKEFAGKALRLEVELNNARVYAIRGDFLTMSHSQTQHFMRTGEKPIPRPGF